MEKEKNRFMEELEEGLKKDLKEEPKQEQPKQEQPQATVADLIAKFQNNGVYRLNQLNLQKESQDIFLDFGKMLIKALAALDNINNTLTRIEDAIKQSK